MEENGHNVNACALLSNPWYIMGSYILRVALWRTWVVYIEPWGTGCRCCGKNRAIAMAWLGQNCLHSDRSIAAQFLFFAKGAEKERDRRKRGPSYIVSPPPLYNVHKCSRLTEPLAFFRCTTSGWSLAKGHFQKKR
jgi:hypothetical protein